MYLLDSHVQLVNVEVAWNFATGSGSLLGTGIHAQGGSTVLHDVSIHDNVADGLAGASVSGVGLFMVWADVTADFVTFARNDGFGNVLGGTISATDSTLVGHHIDVRDHVMGGASVYGGVVYLARSTADLTNLVIAGVAADAPHVEGGIFDIHSSTVQLDQATLTAITIPSDSTGTAAGIRSLGSTVYVYNTTISGITAPSTALAAFSSSSVTVETSAFFGNTGGNTSLPNILGTNGNIEADPQFVSATPATPATVWNLHLASGSALRGAGIDSSGNVTDIGAFGGPGGSW
jgi:hypothetical protein